MRAARAAVNVWLAMDPDAPLPIFDATQETFDELVRRPPDELVVVSFWGEGCPNCEVFAADAPSLLHQLPRDKLRLVRLNAYEHSELALQLNVYSIPSFALFKDGQLLGKLEAYFGREHWLAVVRKHLPA